MHVRVRVRVCVLACVLISSTAVEGYTDFSVHFTLPAECTDQRSCVLGIILDISAKFLHLTIFHLQRRENGICACRKYLSKDI